METTKITVEVDMEQYQLGNKYDAVTFKITQGRGNGSSGKGNRFNTEVEPGDTLIWTGKYTQAKYENEGDYDVEIREISSKEELGYLNLFESIQYKDKEAKGKIKKEYKRPEGIINSKVSIELYNITIRVTVPGHVFPDFTIDPVLTIHMD